MVDLALKRASLFLLPTVDLYRIVFIGGHANAGQSWAKLGLALLTRWGVLDWPAWSKSSSFGGMGNHGFLGFLVVFWRFLVKKPKNHGY